MAESAREISKLVPNVDAEILPGAETYSKGFIISILSEKYPSLLMQLGQKDCRNLKEHFTKPSEQVAAPNCICSTFKGLNRIQCAEMFK